MERKRFVVEVLVAVCVLAEKFAVMENASWVHRELRF